MISPKKFGQNGWLWWTSIVSLAIGLSIYILLQPADYDYTVQRYRSLALIAGLMISGLCVIIGTSKRWFGKGL
jgi:hypothetical protein